ncbi:putative membrane protein [Caballeronia arvi]|uniref:Membrane protein n=1 Tax=Caballeronia arvi TaxID=1777135 RepID=A0A158JC35_9BURK|nr:VC0807 family protein [Caballeronia arvi]SAL65979.1 putative membrane protein [Caballeronia arvi]
MMPSARYAFAVVINVLLPMAAYRLALGHYGVAGALLASMAPLLLWLCIDLARFRHFDALSAIVLAGIVMSLCLLALKPADWLIALREPAVSGVIGVMFLVSLMWDRPIVYYLARSTMSRERQGRELEFDAMWQSRPALVRSIRLMTTVWGIGLLAENIVRLGVLERMNGDDAQRASTYVRYVFYGALTAWTIFYRRAYLRKQAPD